MTPPPDPLGHRMSVTLTCHLRDERRRDSEQVTDIIGRWVVRYARRTWPAFDVEGWSPNADRGRTYIDYWFASVEVYLVRRAA